MKSAELHVAYTVIISLQYYHSSAQYYIEDPCPLEVKELQLPEVTMCSSSYAVSNAGEQTSQKRAIIRVNKYEENCTCHINTTDPLYVYFSPYNYSSDVVPNGGECGLVVDVSLGYDDVIEPQLEIGCHLEKYNRTPIYFRSWQYLRLSSKVVDAKFEKGYCLQLFVEKRKYQPDLHIQCFGPTITTSTYQTTLLPSPPATTPPPDITSNDPSSSEFDQTTHQLGLSHSPIRKDEVGDNTDDSSLPYILTGVFAGTSIVFLTLFIIVFILYKRLLQSKTIKPYTNVQDTYDSIVNVADTNSYSSLSPKVPKDEKYENLNVSKP